MPQYVYKCDQCGDQLEVIQTLREAPLTECTVPIPTVSEDGESMGTTTCGGRLRKQVQPMNFTLRGRGFHNTDYR